MLYFLEHKSIILHLSLEISIPNSSKVDSSASKFLACEM